MKKLHPLIVVLLSAATLFAAGDSLYFGYSDFGSYEVMSARISFTRDDSLSYISLSGNRTETFYESYSKDDLGINGEISVRHRPMLYGVLLSSDYISNSSISRPTQSNIRILPMIGYGGKDLELKAAYGYIGRTDELTQKTGGTVYAEGKYSGLRDDDSFSASASFRGDDTDPEYNYGSGAAFTYRRSLREMSGVFSAGGTGSFSRYHYADLDANRYMIRRYEYEIFSDFDYVATSYLRNSAGISFYARNRDSFRDSEGTGYNSNSDIKLSDEIFYNTDRLGASFKIEFDTGSDKFSAGQTDSERSLSYYNIALSPRVSYRTGDYLFSMNSRYVKHEYKSLTSSNLEDRDIIKIQLTPEAAYTLRGRFSAVQSFPLEYYKLVNISSQRSVNNYTDRAVASVTDIRYDLSEDLYFTKNLKFRSYFRSYDYDDTYSSSFVRKNYSVSDTVSFRIVPGALSKLCARYTYEEFGNFNYSDFTENPVDFSNHYYSSLSFYFGSVRSFSLRTEYYFYETDRYDFDQEDFSDSRLRSVYISHGPKLGVEYNRNRFFLFSGLEIENYRKGESLTRFRVESYISFR